MLQIVARPALAVNHSSNRKPSRQKLDFHSSLRVGRSYRDCVSVPYNDVPLHSIDQHALAVLSAARTFEGPSKDWTRIGRQAVARGLGLGNGPAALNKVSAIYGRLKNFDLIRNNRRHNDSNLTFIVPSSRFMSVPRTLIFDLSISHITFNFLRMALFVQGDKVLSWDTLLHIGERAGLSPKSTRAAIREAKATGWLCDGSEDDNHVITYLMAHVLGEGWYVKRNNHRPPVKASDYRRCAKRQMRGASDGQSAGAGQVATQIPKDEGCVQTPETAPLRGASVGRDEGCTISTRESNSYRSSFLTPPLNLLPTEETSTNKEISTSAISSPAMRSESPSAPDDVTEPLDGGHDEPVCLACLRAEFVADHDPAECCYGANPDGLCYQCFAAGHPWEHNPCEIRQAA